MLVHTGKPGSLKTIVPDRPGHDRRYLLDSSKLRRELGWEPEDGWEDGLRPGPQAPVWSMDAFRDRFLSAFGSQPAAG